MSIKIYPPLYKFDTKGKIREWELYVLDNKFICNYGLKNGKKIEQVKVCKGKNIGKSNETTDFEQALKEGEARWLKQIRIEDYNEDVNEAGLQNRPMLAHDYRKVPKRVTWSNVECQVKLDGLRLVGGYRWDNATDVELMSRKGEVYPITHFQQPTEQLLDIIINELGYGCNAIDGEAYIHGMKLQHITSLARKSKPESSELKYYLFDLVMYDTPFDERYDILEEALEIYTDRNNGDDYPFTLVDLKVCKNEDEMKLFHGLALEQGYEGAMIRHRNGKYKKGRSADLFKYKEFFDVECKIVDMKEDNNQNAMLVVIAPNGENLDCTPKRTHKERKEMLKNPDDYIGKWITVKYQALTESGNLQFPVGLDIRECDENGNPIL